MLERIVNLIEATLGWAAAVGFTGYVIYAFLVAPMARNYAECGTIFLCANQ